MFTTIIIDDEYLIRNLIRNSVDFEALDFEIVGEAEDGQQALELINEMVPDLIILDINIPLINGVELAKHVRGQYADMKIIVLTGYGEFEYAKEFIKIGVSDYVLKPLQPEAFAEVLVRVKAELMQQLEQKDYLENLKREAEQNTDALRTQFLVDILDDSNYSEVEFETKLASIKSDLHSKNLVLVTVEIDDSERKFRNRDQRRLANNALHNITLKHLAQRQPAMCFFDVEQRLILMVNGNRDDLHDILEGCASLAHEVIHLLNFTISTGISSVAQSYQALPRLYQEAVYALSEKFFLGKGTINIYSQEGAIPRAQEPLLIRSKEKILPHLRTANQQAFVSFLRDLESQVISTHSEIENVYAAYSEIVVEVMKYAWENNIRTDEVFPAGINYIDVVRVNETLSDLTVWMIGLYDSVLDLVLSRNRKRPNQIVERARMFIEENYFRSDLTIEEVAERNFINPSHLSKLFRREMKCSMIEYLTDLRMKKAKEILDIQPKLQIGEVAQQVGYDDPFYFSKLFKKVFGLSPSQYVHTKTQSQ